jgi:hypothetical protein
MGFILADGSFDKNGRIAVGLAKKDLDHLTTLSLILESNIIPHEQYYSTSKQNKLIGKRIQEKFDVKQNKTIHPPNTNKYNFTGEQKLALIIGFIDGDGCILNQSGGRRDCFLRIKNHRSWINFHNWCRENISLFTKRGIPQAKVNKSGYSELVISQNKILVFLKEFSLKKKLPILKRKWSKVIDYINRNEKHSQTKEYILKLKRENKYKDFEIAKLAGVCPATVSMILRGLR